MSSPTTTTTRKSWEGSYQRRYQESRRRSESTDTPSSASSVSYTVARPRPDESPLPSYSEIVPTPPPLPAERALSPLTVPEPRPRRSLRDLRGRLRRRGRAEDAPWQLARARRLAKLGDRLRLRRALRAFSRLGAEDLAAAPPAALEAVLRRGEALRARTVQSAGIERLRHRMRMRRAFAAWIRSFPRAAQVAASRAAAAERLVVSLARQVRRRLARSWRTWRLARASDAVAAAAIAVAACRDARLGRVAAAPSLPETAAPPSVAGEPSRAEAEEPLSARSAASSSVPSPTTRLCQKIDKEKLHRLLRRRHRTSEPAAPVARRLFEAAAAPGPLMPQSPRRAASDPFATETPPPPALRDVSSDPCPRRGAYDSDGEESGVVIEL